MNQTHLHADSLKHLLLDLVMARKGQVHGYGPPKWCPRMGDIGFSHNLGHFS